MMPLWILAWMTLYYAIGGGLGHLTRARAVIHTLGLEHATLLTASVHASDPRVTGGLPVIRAPEGLDRDVSALRKWLVELFEQHRFKRLVLDTFPCGILGEFEELELPGEPSIDCVARLLRWGAYDVPDAFPLDRVWTVEELQPAHQAWLESNAERIEPLELKDPPGDDQGIDLPSGCWLVVHSGPEEEVRELIDYARELQRMEGIDATLIAVSPVHLDGIRCIDAYPAVALFPRAARLVTAGGFNAMRQTALFRDRHHAVPFERRFDDQFARVALLR